ncbi:unnamed protein product [Microthlaspi erraticum]|uniref:TIR domain-containing protein n=1 Tax=Microthlaspi erraticum TaxID=1685480 RepID=A0A6D2JTA8_9BRAS|nr:unnamed protein product [Microthlaspi erraticum]
MASSSSSTRHWMYDVFLSFRGLDTRRNIVSHLYSALCNNGIRTFKDDQTMEKGDPIPDKLLKAIKTSQFAIIVISENYATSTWCLEELKTIMELRKAKGGIIVIPIFYGVDPSDVRRQGGSFETAFASMGQRPETADKVLKWREALTGVAVLQGFDSRKCMDEATMVEDAVRRISNQLLTEHTTDHDEDIVGMSSHMESLGSLLEMESDEEVRFVGILGMGGVGKTTIAKYLYGRFARHFSADCRCFVENVGNDYREKGLLYLEENFLSKFFGVEQTRRCNVGSIKAKLRHRKVFVVLDDVDKVEQLHGLAKDPSCFGPGSRIIITTRDKGILDTYRVKTHVYPVKCLDQDDALHMFKHIVSKGEPSPDGVEQLLIRASRLAHGLPYALKFYSSELRWKKTKEEWEKAVLEWEEAPHKNIMGTLRSIYDRLGTRDKIAFLHVACLFNGDSLLRASSLLDCGESRIRDLVEQSLVDISAQGCIHMNVLVEQIGREIVLEESGGIPQRQRILWDPEHVYDVLHGNTGTESIEGLALHMCDMRDVLTFQGSGFQRMHNVKFLKFYTHLDNIRSNLQLLPHTASLPRTLRLLHWDSYPLTTLPSDFSPRSLIDLSLRYSNLHIVSNRNLDLRNLKRLDVSGSKELRELPDLSRAIQLKELVAEGCRRLERILMPIKRQYALTKLDLSNCVSLQTLPAFIPEWISLAQQPIYFRCHGTGLTFEINSLNPFASLSIEGDIRVRLQQLVGDAEHLSYVSDIFGKSLKIKRSSYMEDYAPFSCVSLSDFSHLAELKLINLNIREVPDDIDQLHLLEKLDLSGNDFKCLPTTLDHLDKLHHVLLCNYTIYVSSIWNHYHIGWASLRFAGIPGNVMSSYLDNQAPRLSPNLLGFTACIKVSCDGSFHLQFPVSSYSWKWEAGGVFQINLRPDIYRSTELESQESLTSHHLIIIQVLTSEKIGEASRFEFKSNLQFSQDFTSPPVGIKVLEHN